MPPARLGWAHPLHCARAWPRRSASWWTSPARGPSLAPDCRMCVGQQRRPGHQSQLHRTIPSTHPPPARPCTPPPPLTTTTRRRPAPPRRSTRSERCPPPSRSSS
jgi:hypothetical protein